MMSGYEQKMANCHPDNKWVCALSLSLIHCRQNDSDDVCKRLCAFCEFLIISNKVARNAWRANSLEPACNRVRLSLVWWLPEFAEFGKQLRGKTSRCHSQSHIHSKMFVVPRHFFLGQANFLNFPLPHTHTLTKWQKMFSPISALIPMPISGCLELDGVFFYLAPSAISRTVFCAQQCGAHLSLYNYRHKPLPSYQLLWLSFFHAAWIRRAYQPIVQCTWAWVIQDCALSSSRQYHTFPSIDKLIDNTNICPAIRAMGGRPNSKIRHD